MPKLDLDFFSKRAQLNAAVHSAIDALFAIDGRTDRTPLQIVSMYPDNAAVKKWKQADQALRDFDEGKVK